LNHIELFAGCGGLSLGLELAGFELILANELSPMAAESFAYNLLNEDLNAIANNKEKRNRTFWLSSKHKELKPRLRENPFDFPEASDTYSDLPQDVNHLKGSLLVGNIIHLNKLLDTNDVISNAIRSGFNDGEVDLVSGGPPCQSFSLAGLREKDNDKNTLPWEFANFVEHIQPKFVILENVTGILRTFKQDGIEYHAWFEVAKAFARKGYIPLCLHINAKLSGVPQNRPRFIMLGVRLDVYESLQKSFNEFEKGLFEKSLYLYKRIKNRKRVDIDSYKYFDVNRSADFEIISNSFLAPIISGPTVNVKDAINDLKVNSSTSPSKYVKNLNSLFNTILGKHKVLNNHELRRNSDLVRRRFRIYQVLQSSSKITVSEVLSLWKNEKTTITNEAWKELSQQDYVVGKDSLVKFKSKTKFINYLKAHATKKRTQKALNKSLPAPAALSIPDDACHYDEAELRTLTVREMARIQSFPDSFVFKSKVTTGGKMRRFEVPQYTQVGNAVPPLLGVALGNSIKALIDRLK